MVIARVYLRRGIQLDPERVSELFGRVDTKVAEVTDPVTFTRNLKYLRKAGIREKDLALLLGVYSRTLRFWVAGKHYPKDIRYFLTVNSLVKLVKEQQAQAPCAVVTSG